MKKSCFILCCLLWSVCFGSLQAQASREAYLHQSLDYYFITNQYDQALRVIDTLDRKYGLSHINLDYALKLAIKYERKKLAEQLLRESGRHFNFAQSLEYVESDIQEWLSDSTFTFKKYFGKKWARILSDCKDDPTFTANLKSAYHEELAALFSVDQFVRMSPVSKTTFLEVDSLNLDAFTGFLANNDPSKQAYSRLNNQMIYAMLRHIGKRRFQEMDKNGGFHKLIEAGTISNNDYAMISDYLNAGPLYFPAYDAFIDEDWKKAGIADKQELMEIDRRRTKLGLLPLEYCAFCIRKNVTVPGDLKYASPIENLIQFHE